MSYYKVLGFKKEPFSTSPDPEFFYESRGHETALTNLIIEVRLRRGLSIVLGDVGTGKTTLSRKLCQVLKQREDIIFHMVLDPHYEHEKSFLMALLRNFGAEVPPEGATLTELKESLERFLFRKGVEEKRTVVLIVDEAQTLKETTLETLRLLLNYETNEFKLIQVILLGQMELHAKIMNIANFLDRVSFKYTLNPLELDDVRELVAFRVKQAGYDSNMQLFSEDGIREIHRVTKGYPRKIAMLCHKALKGLVLKRRFVVDRKLVDEVIDQEAKQGWVKTETPELLQKSSY